MGGLPPSTMPLASVFPPPDRGGGMGLGANPQRSYSGKMKSVGGMRVEFSRVRLLVRLLVRLARLLVMLPRLLVTLARLLVRLLVIVARLSAMLSANSWTI